MPIKKPKTWRELVRKTKPQETIERQGIGDYAWRAAKEAGKTTLDAISGSDPALEATGVVMPLSVTQGAMKAIPAAKKVYHGTPHAWAPEPGYPLGRFKPEAVGTGEGAAAYGHAPGGYWGEAKATGEAYKQSVSRGTLRLQVPEDAPLGVYGWSVDASSKVKGDNPSEYVSYLQDKINTLKKNPHLQSSQGSIREAEELIEMIQSGRATIKPSGYVVEGELLAADADFLLWDKPLSEQSEKVQKVFKEVPLQASRKYVVPTSTPRHYVAANADNIQSGRDAYALLSETLGSEKQFGKGATQWSGRITNEEAATELLRSKGIKGVKYLDEGSRSAGQGTYNYAIFDPEIIRVLKVLGLGTLMAGGAVKVSQEEKTKLDAYMAKHGDGAPIGKVNTKAVR